MIDPSSAPPINPKPITEQIQEIDDQIKLAHKRKELLEAEQKLAALSTPPAAPPPSPPAAPTGSAKPKTGEVTADDQKRILAEVAACEGVQNAADKIVAEITARLQNAPGRILIVDDLLFAVNDISYLDICRKVDALLKSTAQVSKECESLSKRAQPSEPARTLEDLEMLIEKGAAEGTGISAQALFSTQGLLGLAKIAESIVAVGAAASGVGGWISGGLSLVGDIIGYFRPDYVIKGQMLAGADDFYLQAMVAGGLQDKQQQVLLFNFNRITQSKLLDDLNDLLKRKLVMQACAEVIKSQYVDGKEAQIQAIQTTLASLRAKLVDTLLLSDQTVQAVLSREIEAVSNQLNELHSRRTPDIQITQLENHLVSLRAKLVDALAKDPAGERCAVEVEIEGIVQKLKENELANPKKLSAAEIKAFEDQLKGLQARLTELIAASGGQTQKQLQGEIDRALALLKEYQKDRVSDAQISGLENQRVSLQAKLVECQASNDEEAIKNIRQAITQFEAMIAENLKPLQEANGIVQSSLKVSAAIDSFVTTLTAVPAGAAYPPLVAAVLREYIDDLEIKYLLKIKLVTHGADFTVEKPNVFRRNTRTTYIGGGVGSYILSKKDGEVVASGTHADAVVLQHTLGKEPLMPVRITNP